MTAKAATAIGLDVGAGTGAVVGADDEGERAVGRVDLVGTATREFTPTEAAAELAARPLRDDLAADPRLPADTRLWAVLQNACGGTWGGCVYDATEIAAALATPRA